MVALNSFTRASQRGIVLHVRHHEFAAAALGGHGAQDFFHLFDGIRQHGVVVQALLRRREKLRLHFVEHARAAFAATPSCGTHFLHAGVTALEHDVAAREIARARVPARRARRAAPSDRTSRRAIGLRGRRASRRCLSRFSPPLRARPRALHPCDRWAPRPLSSGASFGGSTRPLSSEWLMIRPPTRRVETPQLVCHT